MSAWYHMSAYCSIKASVIRLTEGLAMELAQTNVHVNSMGPGGIHTRMAEEIQDAAAVAVLSELHEICRQVTSGERDSIEQATDLAVFLARIRGTMWPSM